MKKTKLAKKNQTTNPASPTSEAQNLRVLGARVHNLKNIDVEIPRYALTVITGLSGSGKSSLAFDTIYAEGQRRYLETLSAYARQFMGSMERPDVEQITGLSPVIAIEQKTTNKNPRSTVGTITEVYDFLRLLYARAAIAYSSATGEQMVRYTDEQIVQLIIQQFAGKKCALLAPVVSGRKGHYKELFEQLRKRGFLTARINGEIVEIKAQHKLDRYKTHFVEVVIDKLIPSNSDEQRLRESVRTAMQQGKGVMAIVEMDTQQLRYYSRQLMCPSTGISYPEPAPHFFSFNSPQGACPHCSGLGAITKIDIKKIIPDNKISIKKGGIAAIGKYRDTQPFRVLEAIAQKYDFSLDDPIANIPETALHIILYGSEELFRVKAAGGITTYMTTFGGVVSILENAEEDKEGARLNTERFISYAVCPQCRGARLKEDALWFKIDGKNIADLNAMDLQSLYQWFNGLEARLNKKQQAIAKDLLKEIRDRLGFLLDVGLSYLALSRSTRSLSGGESQRIRLATQIGSKLVNVLYILDEPSIGLHQRDNRKLINALQRLRDEGNSVIVVEHDEDMIRHADHVIDMGPGAGLKGGEVVFSGKWEKVEEDGRWVMKMGENREKQSSSNQQPSLTLDYLSGKKKIAVPKQRRKGKGEEIIIEGASGNNLKKVDVRFPLGTFICVTGVSGSGKSTLVNETLQPILSQALYRSYQSPLPYASVSGVEKIDKVVEVDQSPLGRTPRSNPATYTNLFADIRKLFEETPDAKIRGYKAGRFSFNVRGGRCEDCRGAGVQTIEMNFLPDVYATCKACNGKRYNRETLEVKYKGKNINDILELTIDQACEFFEHVPHIRQKLKTLQDVGLGYVKIGQPSTTLSGGESQRVKLSAELAKRDTGNTFYILDEPTTGLHFEDVRILLEVLNKLVERGNTVLVIEHNMDVIKTADYVIDLGPEGGAEGGKIVATGTPEEIVKNKNSFTGQFLARLL
ncbi:MAG: excinuclease ABC subunit UvrA [Bacteroidales bacterium]|nr:excinuclease ABC subunit UvrA [Bacteroidales bacterium]MCL2133437.1 excinuclease ABC subunit UvrA [Bacteroidales bacterium]